MKLTYNQSENGCEAVVEGELTIENAAAFKDEIMKVLDQPGDIHFDLSGVAKIDISCLQILCSAHRALLEQGRNAVLKKISEPFQNTLQKSGLEGYQGCSRETTDKCLWTGGAR